MLLKKAYLFAVSFISLILVLFGATVLLEGALKLWVFPLGNQPNYFYPCMTPVSPNGKAMICDQAAIDAQRKIDQEEHAAQSNPVPVMIIMVIAALIWWIHWSLAKKQV